MRGEEFERLLATIRQADLTADQRRQIADVVKLPRGRPKQEPTMETLGPRYDAVITMRRLQVEGLTLEEAADRAALAHGAGSAETIKSWAKRDDLRSLADKHLSARDRWQAILNEADRLGIEYGRDWPISRLKAAIQSAKGKK